MANKVLFVEGEEDLKRFEARARVLIPDYHLLFLIKSSLGKDQMIQQASLYKEEYPNSQICLIFDGDQRYKSKQREFYEKANSLNARVIFLESEDILEATNKEIDDKLKQAVEYFGTIPYGYISGRSEFIRIGDFLVKKAFLQDCPKLVFCGFVAGGTKPAGLWSADFRKFADKLVYETGQIGQNDLLTVGHDSVAFVLKGKPNVLHVFDNILRRHIAPLLPYDGLDLGIGEIKELKFLKSPKKLILSASKGSFGFDLKNRKCVLVDKIGESDRYYLPEIEHRVANRFLSKGDNHKDICDLRDRPILLHDSDHGFIYKYVLFSKQNLGSN